MDGFEGFFKHGRPSIEQRALFDFVAMRVQQVNNEQHFSTCNQTNTFRSLTTQLFLLKGFTAGSYSESFSNTIDHRWKTDFA